MDALSFFFPRTHHLITLPPNTRLFLGFFRTSNKSKTQQKNTLYTFPKNHVLAIGSCVLDPPNILNTSSLGPASIPISTLHPTIPAEGPSLRATPGPDRFRRLLSKVALPSASVLAACRGYHWIGLWHDLGKLRCCQAFLRITIHDVSLNQCLEQEK